MKKNKKDNNVKYRDGDSCSRSSDKNIAAMSCSKEEKASTRWRRRRRKTMADITGK